MFKKVTKLLGAIALTGWMGVANATLIFDFSWDTPNGEVIGVIEGLQDVLGVQSATSVTLISIDNVAQGIEFVNPGTHFVQDNRWRLADMEIIPIKFFSHSLLSDYRFNLSRYDVYYFNEGEHLRPTGGISFSRRVSVHEPSTVILLSLGLAGLSFVRYRKQS